MSPNRIAIYLTAATDLLAAVLPFIIDFGASEKVIAYTGAILALNAVVISWLQGWQKYEARQEAPKPGTTFQQPGPALPRHERPER